MQWDTLIRYVARAGAKALTGTATVRTVQMREDVSFVANIVDFMI